MISRLIDFSIFKVLTFTDLIELICLWNRKLILTVWGSADRLNQSIDQPIIILKFCRYKRLNKAIFFIWRFVNRRDQRMKGKLYRSVDRRDEECNVSFFCQCITLSVSILKTMNWLNWSCWSVNTLRPVVTIKLFWSSTGLQIPPEISAGDQQRFQLRSLTASNFLET